MKAVIVPLENLTTNLGNAGRSQLERWRRRWKPTRRMKFETRLSEICTAYSFPRLCGYNGDWRINDEHREPRRGYRGCY